MHKYFIAILLACLACTREQALISDNRRLEDIRKMLDEQKQLTIAGHQDIWKVFDQHLTRDEKQGLEFLYAYAPLSDLADYSPEFMLENVRMSLKAREELPWGSSVPEDAFLHFVLPLRVNNENLDSFRIVMYEEIKQRVQGMDMEKAALEINHWCHEKVVYTGTDERTSAPLSTIKKAFGRCGEESTFTVSALRTAGIPARQVYTPRWAHADDNHAWVEAWIKGEWKFLGACEPDAGLNMGWFREPSRRTMLIHTRVYGKYFGDEDVVVREKRFSELNLTSGYARVKRVFVRVKDPAGSAVAGAKVEFQLYNYAEFYPVATQVTDSAGEVSVAIGLGEIIVWGSKDGKYDFKKISVADEDTVYLVLGTPLLVNESFDYDLVPPHPVRDTLAVSEDAKKENERRLTAEDSIRNCYTATFKDSTWSRKLAKDLGLPEAGVIRAIRLCYGNWPELEKYFRENASGNYVMDLLKGISDKDYSDTKAAILTSHLKNTKNDRNYPEDIFVDYVLSPRIRNEMLLDWRPAIQSYFSEYKEQFMKDPALLTEWIRKNIRIDDTANKHSRAPLSPLAVYRFRMADTNSENLFFVSVCRALGIPSRLNPATLEPEYYAAGIWRNAGLTANKPVVSETGFLILKNGNNTIEPQYFIHFTIGRFLDGTYQTLEYDFGKKISDFKEPLKLEPGIYRLVTGSRLADGTVLSSVHYFGIEAGKTTPVTVILRSLANETKPLARLDLSVLKILKLADRQQSDLLTLADGKDLVIALLDPEKEPSKHILNDLTGYVDYFEKWPGKFVFLSAEDKPQLEKVIRSYPLPKNQVQGFDQNGEVLKAMTDLFGGDLKEKLPLVLLTDSQGQIYLFSSGYKIGIGEQILKMIPSMSANSCRKG
ncbi:MAG: transglutaminase domain-containing protein [Mangrovibacterium sp.]